jgi:hypothetical protein
MPHFKCAACKLRLDAAASPADMVGDLCPGCGSLLEPVGDLSEIVGFRSIRSREAAGDAPGAHEQIADRVDDFLARRRVILARARLDAQRWIDDGGSFRPEAVPLPRPETNAWTRPPRGRLEAPAAPPSTRSRQTAAGATAAPASSPISGRSAR